jgi:tripartite-type tricarboxylate transporter receptor subunit TctC
MLWKTEIRACCCVVAVMVGPVAASVGHASDYPAKQIRMIVPYPAGGPTDGIGRIGARAIEEKGGKPVFLENRPGGGGLVGLEAAATAAPDGYTFVVGPSSLAEFPVVVKDYSANLTARLAAVALITRTAPVVFMVRASVPANSMKELVDYARANPGKLNFGIASAGGNRLIHLFLNKRFGLEIAEVNYKGTADVQPAMIRGDIHMYIGLPVTWLAQINQGTVRAIGLFSDRRLPALLPGVATMVEQGISELEGIGGAWLGVMAPAGTPRPIIETVNRWLTDYVRSPAGTEQITKLGFEPGTATPQELTDRLASEERRWKAIARETEYRPQ